MPRFGSPTALDASLGRRQVLIGALGLGLGASLAACNDGPPLTASNTPRLDMSRLDKEVARIADGLGPATLGVGLMNMESGEAWTFHGERPFPMQSVFKAPLAAATFAEIDAGRLSLNEGLTLKDTDLSPPYSAIADTWPQRRDYTVGELLVAAVERSDNTAADVLMKRIGGPGAVSAWLVSKKIDEVRVDRYERELQPEIVGLTSFRPSWRGEVNYVSVLQRVPAAARQAAMRRYLADPRDTATPRGMLMFLQQLDSGQLLAPASTRLLIKMMQETPSAPNRLKAALPAGAVLAHKTGTARTDLGVNPAVNDVGIVTLADKRSYAIAVFLSGTTLDEAGRDAAIASVGRAVLGAVG